MSTSVYLRQLTEVLLSFLKLGLTSFGGPIAHIGFYRKAFVEDRAWMNDQQFGQLLSLCQFLPGPASSQMGFSIGMHRAGILGGLIAFIAFTSPSAVILYLLALYLPNASGLFQNAVIHGLKLVALVVVFQAVIQMGKKLCPDWQRVMIAFVTIIIISVVTSVPFLHLIIVFISGVIGMLICKPNNPIEASDIQYHYSRKVALLLLVIFLSLLLLLPLLASPDRPLISVANAFYSAGALVFGGGHVVLPLLEEAVVQPGWISSDNYLAGYGAAQAVPGPVFTVSAYLGAILPEGMGGATGALIALISIFLPGFLLVAGILPFWQGLLKMHLASKAVAGVNAAVVGILAAALYNPIWISVVQRPADLLIAMAGYCILEYFKVSVLYICLWCVGLSLLMSVSI